MFVHMQIMRETLIYLSHLDHEDTEKQVYIDNGSWFLFLLLKNNKHRENHIENML